jgi:hypothetical protein
MKLKYKMKVDKAAYPRNSMSTQSKALIMKTKVQGGNKIIFFKVTKVSQC